MSAEVENNKDEEAKQQPPKKTIRQRFEDNWQLGLKIIELLLCVFCIGFAFDSVKTIGLGNSDLHHIGIMFTTYIGYILININFIISREVLKDHIPYRTSAIFSISASTLFLITAILLIADRSAQIRRYSYDPYMYELNLLVVSVICAFLNSTIFAIDAVFTFRRQQDF